jgi:hypothetical protein
MINLRSDSRMKSWLALHADLQLTGLFGSTSCALEDFLYGVATTR